MSTPWLFTQNSTPRSACPHEQITLANDEEPTLCCRSCSKRWTFVPAGETPRYCPDDDPTYPGMLDNRGWSKSTRVAMGDDHGHGAAIARDIQLDRASQQIRDEIIAQVGMMADARTPEMQARYDAAVARERGRTIAPGDIFVTITGSNDGDDATTIARAILEMLQEADVRCSMPEEIENPYEGDSIEQLGTLRRSTGRRLCVIVQTNVA